MYGDIEEERKAIEKKLRIILGTGNILAQLVGDETPLTEGEFGRFCFIWPKLRYERALTLDEMGDLLTFMEKVAQSRSVLARLSEDIDTYRQNVREAAHRGR